MPRPSLRSGASIDTPTFKEVDFARPGIETKMTSMTGTEKKDMAAESTSSQVRRGRLGLILYTPPSSALLQFGVELAKAALARGYSVHMFALGDSVYATTKSALKGKYGLPNVTIELCDLLAQHGGIEGGFRIDLCSTCYIVRGLSQDDAIPGAAPSGTHRMVELLQTCDRTIALVP